MPGFATIFYFLIGVLALFLGYIIYQLFSNKNNSPKAKSNNTPPDMQSGSLIGEVVFKLEKIEKLLSISMPRNSALNKVQLLQRFDNVYFSISELQAQLHRQKTSRLINITTHSVSETTREKLHSEYINEEPISTLVQSAEGGDSMLQELYNQAVTDRSIRPQFWAKYNAITLGNKNAVEQRLGRATEPDFREASNGDFIAIKRDQGVYFVLPQFDLTLTPQKYTEGGVKSIFDCPNYDSKSSYSNIKVRRPAILERRGGECWKILKAGELIL